MPKSNRTPPQNQTQVLSTPDTPFHLQAFGTPYHIRPLKWARAHDPPLAAVGQNKGKKRYKKEAQRFISLALRDVPRFAFCMYHALPPFLVDEVEIEEICVRCFVVMWLIVVQS